MLPDIIDTDHGLSDYLLELYNKLGVNFGSRSDFITEIVQFINQNQNNNKLGLSIYQKL